MFERDLVAGLGGNEIAFAPRGVNAVEPRPGLFLVAPHQHNFRAGTGHPFGHRPTKFAGAADHDGDATSEREE